VEIYTAGLRDTPAYFYENMVQFIIKGVFQMRYDICQLVKIVDMSDELITEVVFNHGEVETPIPAIGATVVTYPLGLKEFTVVYDKREMEAKRSKIIDLEINLLGETSVVKVFLEPVTLIVGQHDVGEF
jgi:hypothetical protein